MCQHLIDRTRPKGEFAKPIRVVGFDEVIEREPWQKAWIVIDPGRFVKAYMGKAFGSSKGYRLD